MLSRARRPGTLRAGITAIELLVVLAVLAILAAVVVNNVAPTVNTGRSAGLAESLDALRQSIYAYRGDVRRYPTHLRYLSVQPGSATDLCGRTVPPAFLDEWRGPYTGRTITTAGLPVDDATIQDALEPPASPGIEASGTLYIVVEDVDEVLAEDLERAYDDGAGSTGVDTDGMIQWTDTAPTGDGSGQLKFGLAIRGC